MASTFERCPKSVEHMAKALLEEFETHKPLLDSGAVIDYVFARAECDDETGEPKGYAIVKNGVRALGVARKIPLKDRALGRGDAEITLDGDHWDSIAEDQQRAILDHELHHLTPKVDKRGLVRDDLGHPVIQLRKHDYEFGWFNVIAARHKAASVECHQAKVIFDNHAQAYWPEIAKAIRA